jgi:hypothetical protein
LTDYLAKYRKDIEANIGAPLKPEEMMPVADLNGLSAAQVDVARRLARRQLALCTIYLEACAGVGVREAMQYITRVLLAPP